MRARVAQFGILNWQKTPPKSAFQKLVPKSIKQTLKTSQKQLKQIVSFGRRSSQKRMLNNCLFHAFFGWDFKGKSLVNLYSRPRSKFKTSYKFLMVLLQATIFSTKNRSLAPDPGLSTTRIATKRCPLQFKFGQIEEIWISVEVKWQSLEETLFGNAQSWQKCSLIERLMMSVGQSLLGPPRIPKLWFLLFRLNPKRVAIVPYSAKSPWIP